MASFSLWKSVPPGEIATLPLWRRPVSLLFLMAAGMPLAFSTWVALLNNFVVENAAFDGIDIGWLQTVREIPGFLAVGVIAIIIFMREQILAAVALLTLGAAVAVTSLFPTFGGLLATTLIGSLGFHYYATVTQSLQLQWIDKRKAPQVLGVMVAVGSGASLLAYGGLVIFWKAFDLSYGFVYGLSGGATILIALVCLFAYPQFEAPSLQHKKMVLRRRYWLYYALQFMAGARRQIFVVFAAFMMVEHFGFEVQQVTALLLVNFVANMFLAPLMGQAVARFGERKALLFEYLGLVAVFSSYAGIYFFGWGAVVGAGLYIVDHMFFALAFALKTYFQKIADPADIAPTAAVAFTINHVAAVFLPAALGYLWIVSPGGVFILATVLAVASVLLALMIPRHPKPGRETVFSRPAVVIAE